MTESAADLRFAVSLARIVRLKCPRCGKGRLFDTWFRMRGQCDECHLDFECEPGFYLGSIYFNYGMTVMLLVPVFTILVLGLGVSPDLVLWPSAIFTMLFPLWFFRYSRSIWLSIAWRVSSVDFADGELIRHQHSASHCDRGSTDFDRTASEQV